ncbi:MAG: ABC-2 transporter permease [Lachnospiraceae bacterium]|jgi:ABC-2 type transport system permease protein|nr:ABC-2 transporter permease [Lachnospiraceae bacterium]
MKGLFIKDFQLMKSQKNFFFLILAIAVGMAMYMENIGLISSYLGFIGTMFSLSSINYDEFDNGNPFLFSLPISRREYVLEKYGFGLILGGSFWLMGTVISMAVQTFRQARPPVDILPACLAILPFLPLFLSIMLPLQLKFEGEKGRIARAGVIGVIFLICILSGKLFQTLNLNPFPILQHFRGETLLAALVILCAAMLLLSCRISISIMERKEF